MTEYPTSQEGPQPVASGGRTDESGHGTEELGHGKAPLPAAEAVRTHAQPQAADLPRPRATAEAPSASDGAGEPGSSPAAPGQGDARVRAAGRDGAAAAQVSGIGVDATIARREGDRLRFVGAATRRIARGIDLDEIVLGLCRATVPTFSDAILVYLRDPLPVGDERPVGPVVLRLRRTDRLRPIDEFTGAGAGTAGAATTADGELDFSQLALVGPQGDLPAAELCEIRPGGALAEVLRGVRPVFGSSAAARAALPELLGADHPVPRGQRAILAPLRGRRRVIGAAVFLRTPERPAFETNDLLVAAQLATHTALGIDKAVLYGREAYIADELQRTMLPDSLPQPTGVRLASRYLPAAETARVGGDWYDAIPLPGSRVALVVGDVMGHSMTSAAIMGQLRTTAQTLAQLDLPPAEVLHHLDEQAQRLGSDRMATCLYAVYDPVSHRITIANAGHPPPVLLHLGGRAEVLRVPPGAPIGVGGVDFEAVELDAPAGATLVLYTDGLVESRLRDVWTGIEQLRERLATTAQLTGLDHPPPLEALCDDILDMLGPGDRDDDIALLAARFDGIAPSDVAYWFLDPEETAPGRARRFARRALARWGLEELEDSLELLVSEVVTNAVRYAERPVTLRLLRTDVLRCEVGDDSPQLPRQRRARDDDEGGRGLFLVNRMARRWGATRLSSGKVVWFELALPTAPGAPERR
ncbi:ATP-binding SpoIIE family protein phosphatase [Streptomyces sp. NPDC002812]|uniref:ATP-binding SpoIIE family protein phosphatase n=1 Tax=unclassified Streptomyces TaxID=2593676 RepID=UPI00203004A6|nr:MULTISPECIES: ATP-binding SpoIIE family protein phosphatase [unclassified Streptomyces]MCM1969174.1 serine/threonine-protein phosphatase [Streptomyces sp. G1]MCX5122769.1 serine/threonine-protein phosphatase [Streptomyces sp. NBC_00347]MCX5296126.1 serine/threonine-protein phosphatase [Streptomyces sp. NBC_00193]